MKIKIDYKIENNTLSISYTPAKDIENGLIIEYGEPSPIDPQNPSMIHQPAIMHDLSKGVTSYELWPDFDRSQLKEVYVEDGERESVIPRW